MAVPSPSFVVGSLPRPQWTRELIEDRNEDRLEGDAAEELLDDAIPSAIHLQERAGLDKVLAPPWAGTQAPQQLIAAVKSEYQVLLDQPR